MAVTKFMHTRWRWETEKGKKGRRQNSHARGRIGEVCGEQRRKEKKEKEKKEGRGKRGEYSPPPPYACNHVRRSQRGRGKDGAGINERGEEKQRRFLERNLCTREREKDGAGIHVHA